MIYARSVMPGGTLSGKVVRLLPLTRMLLVIIRRIFGHFLLFMLKVRGRSTPFWCWARFYFRIFCLPFTLMILVSYSVLSQVFVLLSVLMIVVLFE